MFKLLRGFEGSHDSDGHRGKTNGWKSKFALEARIEEMIDNNTNNLSEIQAQWAIVRGKIRQKMEMLNLKSWIKIISLKDFVDGKVILSVPSNFIRTRIIEQYLDIIKSYWLVQNLKINDIEIVVLQDAKKKTQFKKKKLKKSKINCLNKKISLVA